MVTPEERTYPLNNSVLMDRSSNVLPPLPIQFDDTNWCDWFELEWATSNRLALVHKATLLYFPNIRNSFSLDLLWELKYLQFEPQISLTHSIQVHLTLSFQAPLYSSFLVKSHMGLQPHLKSILRHVLSNVHNPSHLPKEVFSPKCLTAPQSLYISNQR